MDAFEHNDGLCSWCVGVCAGMGVRVCVCARALGARARVPARVCVCLWVYNFFVACRHVRHVLEFVHASFASRLCVACGVLRVCVYMRVYVCACVCVSSVLWNSGIGDQRLFGGSPLAQAGWSIIACVHDCVVSVCSVWCALCVPNSLSICRLYWHTFTKRDAIVAIS